MALSMCLRVLVFLAAAPLEAGSIAVVITPSAVQLPQKPATIDAVAKEQLGQKIHDDQLRSNTEKSMMAAQGQKILQELDALSASHNTSNGQGQTNASTKQEPQILEELDALAARLNAHVNDMKQKQLMRDRETAEYLSRPLNASKAHNSTQRMELIARIKDRNLKLREQVDRWTAEKASKKVGVEAAESQPHQEAVSGTQFEEHSPLRDSFFATHLKQIAMVIAALLILLKLAETTLLKVLDANKRRQQKNLALNQLHHEHVTGGPISMSTR